MNNIFYKNKDNFDEIIQNITSDGNQHLHFLADFDRTMTQSFVKGIEKPSLVSVLRDEGYLSEEYRKQAYSLFDHYHPFEISNEISQEEKNQKMEEWWHKHLELLVKSNLKKEDIEKVISSDNIILRPGIAEMLKNIHPEKIPFVIMSANVLSTDSIKLYLQKHEVPLDQISIISNTFIWDENNNIYDYDPRVIHSFNKGEHILEDYPEIFHQVKNRTNVILLGDSIGDPDMIDGFNYKNLLKIGFLNKNEDALMERYLQKYDVVLTGDNDGFFVSNLVKNILNK